MKTQPVPIPIYLPFKPKNRRERKLFIKEVERNIGEIDNLEVDFLNALFEEEDETNYHDLYTDFLDEYKALIKSLHDRGKFKHTTPNLKYFMQKYRPLEKEFEINIPYLIWQ